MSDPSYLLLILKEIQTVVVLVWYMTEGQIQIVGGLILNVLVRNQPLV